MVVSVASPILNIIDAIWVSHRSLKGYPAGTTFRANQLLASQDPVAADFWAAKYILYPVDGNFRHHPDFSGVDRWLVRARDTINGRGGLLNPGKGIRVDRVTKEEAEIRIRTCQAGDFLNRESLSVSRSGLRFLASTTEARTLQKPLTIAVSGARPLPWTIETDGPWLSCAPSSGSGDKTVAIFVQTAGLEPGQHSGRLTIRCPGSANSPLSVSVVLSLIERGRLAENSFRSA
jgi:hypothetical protein